MSSLYNLEVCFTPRLYPALANEDYTVVVIDVLRATSAICTAFEHGLDKLIPCETVEQAHEYKRQGYRVGAERNGEPVEGFDFGNSPYDYMDDSMKGDTVVLTTTNGTHALNMAREADTVVCGAFVNYTALCDWLKKRQRPVLLLCAGWKGRYNMEDALFAGAVVKSLIEDPFFDNAADSALTAMYLYDLAQEDTNKFLHNSSHRKRLAKLNLKEDIRYCLSFDRTSVIPLLENDYLVNVADR